MKKPLHKPAAVTLVLGSLLLVREPSWAAERQLLTGHVPSIVKQMRLEAVERLPEPTTMDVVLGLPLRNEEALHELLRELYDPSSPAYGHYLTPAEFTERFGPMKKDYDKLLAFAENNNLSVVRRHPNRTLLHVRGRTSDIERAFQVALRVYSHPTEDRTFFAPDVEPSLDLDIPVLHVTGLDDLFRPHAAARLTGIPEPGMSPNAGSGPGGLFTGRDFRPAYVPGVSLKGAGQHVGIFTFDGYYESDIRAYETNAGLPHVPLQNVYLNGFTGTPSSDNIEISLDIEMAIAMAPGLAGVVVYGVGGGGSDVVDLLNEMANPTQGEPLPNQLSTSWALYYNDSIYNIFQQMASQGQSFFAFSGDNGAYTGGILPFPPGDYTYVIDVGGTRLFTSGPGGAWTSETTWPSSGGGPSPWFTLPSWQAGVASTANRRCLNGSNPLAFCPNGNECTGGGVCTMMRGAPDVSMVADNIFVICNNGTQTGVGGTSASTPLWAGFTALVNQQAANYGRPPVGFINPALYRIGQGANYSTFFHDITTGSNAHGSDSKYPAKVGYDMSTGWGTPKGASLIDALAGLVWVQFSNPNPGNGTYANPYNTLTRGRDGVFAGGTIVIKGPGSSAETLAISTPMTIRSIGGTATIGQ